MENSSYKSNNILESSESSKESTRECPDCTDTHLRCVKLKHIEIDLCRSCSGIYFDHEELELLLPKKELEQVPMTAKDWAGQALPYAIGEVIFSIFQ